MAKKVRYEPDRNGLREVAREPWIQAVALEGAAKIAAWARQDDPRGGYDTGSATVTAGWDNERRAGAQVAETKRGDGANLRTLMRAPAAVGFEDPGRKMRYTTKDGRTIYATQAQIDNWTRGRQ